MLKHTRHRLKQVKEALKLVEDLDWKVCWALDFSQHADINDILSPISDVLSNATDELEDVQGQLEERLSEYVSRVKIAKAEIAEEFLA